MKSEKLQKWALVAEIVGGLAVVFSLIFVGLEISQTNEETALNTRAIEVSSYQDLIGQVLEINTSRLGNKDLLDALRKDQASEELTPYESQLVGNYAITVYRHGDIAFYQYQQGLIDEVRLQSILGIVITLIRNQPRAQQTWNNSQSLALLPDYKAYVESLL